MAMKLMTSSCLLLLNLVNVPSVINNRNIRMLFDSQIMVSGVSYEEYQQDSNTDKINYETQIRIKAY